MASVDVQTGNISPPGATIPSGGPFTWTCSQVPAGTTITVHATAMPTGHPWFQNSSGQGQISFTTPNASASVTAEGEGNWQYTAAGVNVNAGARVHVSSTMPEAKAS